LGGNPRAELEALRRVEEGGTVNMAVGRGNIAQLNWFTIGRLNQTRTKAKVRAGAENKILSRRWFMTKFMGPPTGQVSI